jgi:hypothetical protein
MRQDISPNADVSLVDSLSRAGFSCKDADVGPEPITTLVSQNLPGAYLDNIHGPCSSNVRREVGLTTIDGRARPRISNSHDSVIIFLHLSRNR